MGLIGSSGKGGVTPLRRNWGEAVENLAGVARIIGWLGIHKVRRVGCEV